MHHLLVAAALLALSLAPFATAQAEEPTASRTTPERCTYSTYQWSVDAKKATNRQSVDKAYADVVDDERDPNEPRCTVCSEDQVALDLDSLGLGELGTIKVCYLYADRVQAALAAIVKSGDFELTALEGYRVGRTRGKVVDGLRTEWSNHAFGTALDVNAEQNGLYGNCNVDALSVEALADCKLRMGGKWDPGKRPRTSITRDSVVYKELTAFWKWGGEIAGDLKDIMHFSITGY